MKYYILVLRGEYGSDYERIFKGSLELCQNLLKLLMKCSMNELKIYGYDELNLHQYFTILQIGKSKAIEKEIESHFINPFILNEN
jgi:hypothetical protein